MKIADTLEALCDSASRKCINPENVREAGANLGMTIRHSIHQMLTDQTFLP